MKKAVNKPQLFKICPGCSLFMNIREEGVFCTLCGQTLISQCPNCSTDIINPYDKFCRHCGAAYRKEDIFIDED